MVLPRELEERLKRVLVEQRQQHRLRNHGLAPRRKLLLLGPPGSGKTMTAAALAGELRVPLFTVVFDSLISKFMGETASKLRLVFEAMVSTRGVYFFDEFDAIGACRSERNDVGEIRRVLNSFLQLLENDDSEGLIIAATNHRELLDPALFRRFDDVISYSVPDEVTAVRIIEMRLSSFNIQKIDWDEVIKIGVGMSQSDLARTADDAAKRAEALASNFSAYIRKFKNMARLLSLSLAWGCSPGGALHQSLTPFIVTSLRPGWTFTSIPPRGLYA